MRIIENNKELSFNICGYQFKQMKSTITEYNYDANWLNCEIEYFENGSRYVYTDSCLLTYELEELIFALSKIIKGKESSYISAFMEPYLKIAIAKVENKMLFIVNFVYDTLDGIWKTRKIASVVEVEHAVQILNELKELQRKYPER